MFEIRQPRRRAITAVISVILCVIFVGILLPWYYGMFWPFLYSFQSVRDPLSKLEALCIRDGESRCIFFVETSGFVKAISGRELCSVESAARTNPETSVVYLIQDPPITAPDYSSSPLIHNYEEILGQFSNVHVVKLDLALFFYLSPLLGLQEAAKSSPHAPVHLADLVRVLVLNKLGGIYLDTDIIVMRSLSDIPSGIGLETSMSSNDTYVCNGAMVFRHPNHQFMVQYLEEIGRQLYNASCYECFGPFLATDLVRDWCPNFGNLEAARICEKDGEKLTIQTELAFHPMIWQDWKLYLDSNSTVIHYILNHLKTLPSYAVHFWSMVSRNTNIPQQSVYGLLAKEFCPESIKEPSFWEAREHPSVIKGINA